MRGKNLTFGATVRRAREELEIGLREMAKKIGVSPTYLSKIERDMIPPPAEDKIIAIGNLLGIDSDELLALAGKVSSDLTEIIREKPREMASFLRATRELTSEQIARLAEEARKEKD